MKLTPIAKNVNVIETEEFDILFSYQTPVACYNKQSGLFARTDKKWSAATTRHINNWLEHRHGTANPVEVIGQRYFDKIGSAVQ